MPTSCRRSSRMHSQNWDTCYSSLQSPSTRSRVTVSAATLTNERLGAFRLSSGRRRAGSEALTYGTSESDLGWSELRHFINRGGTGSATNTASSPPSSHPPDTYHFFTTLTEPHRDPTQSRNTVHPFTASRCSPLPYYSRSSIAVFRCRQVGTRATMLVQVAAAYAVFHARKRWILGV
ncbi:hypothetical protein BD413DRAFT_36352 [Trametes elegans]|nr:hypothetical protein BD413DRAFT_36352 [Trametes elegans]